MENVLDITILFTALVAGFLGWRLGVIRTVVPLVGSGAGVFIAIHYHDSVVRYVPEGIGSPEVVDIVAGGGEGGTFVTIVSLYGIGIYSRSITREIKGA